jgi:tetratricopeptide (TPR) repeat protein
MLLDYERYQVKSKKKKKLRLIIILLLILGAGVGVYFLITAVFFSAAPLPALMLLSPAENLRARWQEFLLADKSDQQGAKREENEKKILDDILTLCDESLKGNSLDLQFLVYHGYASFYRARFESAFENQLPYFNQAVVSLRRALDVANEEMRPQLCYMLGKAYYNKRNYYYDLAAKYLEKALNLGYKGRDTYGYLVSVNDEWGNTEKAIDYLEQAYKDNQSDLYLFHLAKSYKKLNKTDEAADLLTKILRGSTDAELLREAKFLSGEIYFDKRDYRAAEKMYRDILKDDDNSAEAHFRLALIYEKISDYAQYRYELRRTLEKDPGHSGARSRL